MPKIKRVQRKRAIVEDVDEESKGGQDSDSSAFSPSSGEDLADDSEYI